MATELRAGARLHDLSEDDIRRILEDERARSRVEVGNLKPMELTIPVPSPSTSFFIADTAYIDTPAQGYVWSLKLVSCTLSAAGTLAVFKSSSSGDVRRCLDVVTGITVGSATYAQADWSSDSAVLKHGEGIYLLSGVNISSIYVKAEQVTAEKVAQLYD